MLVQRTFVLLACFAWSVQSAPLDDLVESLPLYGRPPTPQFSGYLDASDGCDLETNGPLCRLHYWFALADTEEPLEAPVVLWLNGGPGSSSILGFLEENGPLLINATGGLMENPWSWTKVANLLVLEAPIGVGYSYCSRQQQGKPCRNTDKFTASASRAALVDFFTKFPELVDLDFFITGESYAGIYIPTLSKEILDNAPQINLVGIAVGDPCTDNTAQRDSMDALWYSHKYGLTDDAVFDKLWNQCNHRVPTLMAHGGPHMAAAQLNQELLKLRATGAGHDTPANRRRWAESIKSRFLLGEYHHEIYQDTPECNLAFRKFLLSSSKALSQGWGDLYIDDYSLFAPVSSQQDDDMASYMTRSDVRAALHVEESPTSTWPRAHVGFEYHKQYDACNPMPEEDAWSMIDFYRDIVPRLEIAWVYNGDTDPCVSYEGTRTAMKRVGFEEIDGGSYRPWFYNQTETTLEVLAEKAPLFGPNLLVQRMGAQIGGEVVDYAHGLSFLTVHGSGHMVPQFRPQAALHMLDRLVNFAMLSPLLPDNETLIGLSESEFVESMDKWTENAMSSVYVSTQLNQNSVSYEEIFERLEL